MWEESLPDRVRFLECQPRTMVFYGVYDDPVWKTFSERLTTLAKELEGEKLEKETVPQRPVEEEITVEIDDKHYGRCPKCGTSFNDSIIDFGRLFLCRMCGQKMRLRRKTG